MSKKKLLFTVSVIIPILLAAASMLSVILNNNQASMPIPLKLEFTGEYTYDEEQWYPLTEESDISAFDGDLIVRGSFQREIPQGAMLAFLANHIAVSISLNEERMYIDTPMEIKNYGIDLMPSMCGRRWEHALSPGIGLEDEIKIYFMNYHEYGNKNAYKEALSTFYMTPTNKEVLESYLKPYWKSLDKIGYGMIIAAIILIGASISAFTLKSSFSEKLFKMGMVTLFVGGYTIFDIMTVYLGDELLVTKTYGRQLSVMLALYFLELIIKDIFIGRKRKLADILMGLSAVVNCIIMILSINGRVLIFDTQIVWVISQLILCPFFIICSIHEIFQKENKNKLDLFVFIFLLGAVLLDIAGVGYSVYNANICFKIAFFIVILIYLLRGARNILIDHYAAIEKEKLEEELANNRISIMKR